MCGFILSTSIDETVYLGIYTLYTCVYAHMNLA